MTVYGCYDGNLTLLNVTFNESNLPLALTVDDTRLVHMYRPASEIFDKYLTPVWYIIGFPANLLSFFVWIQKKMRPSSGCYLAALAMGDFILLIMHLLFELDTLWKVTTLHVPYWCEMFPIIFYTSQYLSPLLVLAFTIERYISICHPFKREKYCSTRRAVIVIISLIAISLGVNLIQGYFWTYHGGVCELRLAVLKGHMTQFFTVWSWVIELLVFGLVPLTILALNVLVMIEMGRIIKRFGDPSMSNSSSRERTIMLLCVSLYLIISTLPVTLCYVIALSFKQGNYCLTKEEIDIDPEWQRYFSYWNVRIIVQELGMSHYACNFFIYISTGPMFRRELSALIQSVVLRRKVSRNEYSGVYTQDTHLTLNNKGGVTSINTKNGEVKNGSNGRLL